MPHDFNGDGVLRYTPEDAQAGLCEPSQLWKPVPAGALPPRPADATPPTPAPFSGGVPLLRSDNVAAFRQAQIEELWAAAFALRPAVLLGDRQAADSFVRDTRPAGQAVGHRRAEAKHHLSEHNAHRLFVGCRSGSHREQGMTLVQGPDGTFAADDESAP